MRSLVRSLSLTAIAVALAVGGCGGSTASIEQSWFSPSLRAGTLTNVVTLSPQGNATLARSAEDQMARDLNSRGIRAVPGYQVMPPWTRGNRTATLAALRNSNYDGIVTMRVIGASQQLDYYPTFDMYWGATWGAVYPQTVIRVEINAYEIPSNKLVWSAISKSVDPDSLSELIDDVTDVAANDLAKRAQVARR